MLLASILLAKAGWIKYLGPADSLLGAAYIAGWICTALGLRRLGVLGSGTMAGILSAVQLAGLLFAELWCWLLLLEPLAGHDNLVLWISDAAWPVSHLYMLVIGVAVLKANVWRGWRRFVPLGCGFASIAVVAAGEIAGRSVMEWTFGIYTASAWTLLGYAVRTGGQGFQYDDGAKRTEHRGCVAAAA